MKKELYEAPETEVLDLLLEGNVLQTVSDYPINETEDW